jgi:2-polyprenyl-3-methyl-5-hydroxy-6-metoxy-1,4-benzoquinol methylase
MAKPRHKYEYRVNEHTAAAKIVRMVGRGRRVLELGSGPGAITRLLHANGCRVIALEIDQKAIELVTPYCERVISCNLNDPAWPSALAAMAPFDVIVAGDVLEHLYDPWATLKNLAPLLAAEGQVILSVPHVGHNAVIACLLAGEFEYQPWGLLDRTHIRFFGIRNIQRLADDAGYKIVEADFVIKNPEQTEFAKRWRRLPAATRSALEANPFGTIYQVVIRLVPHEAAGQALLLEALAVPQAPAGAFSVGAHGSRIMGYLLSFLSLAARARISRILDNIGIRH